MIYVIAPTFIAFCLIFPQQLEGQKFLAENSASVYIQKVCPSLMDPFSTVFELDHVFLQWICCVVTDFKAPPIRLKPELMKNQNGPSITWTLLQKNLLLR